MSENHGIRNGRSEHEDTMGTNVYSSKDNKSMHKSLNGEFILYQTLLEQILEGKDLLKINDLSLFNYFQPDNKTDKEILIEFDKSYQSNKAIYWYTRETCIYQILNKSLRTQNIDHIAPFGPFIRDLHAQLSEEHQSFIKQQNETKIEVYRGQLISKDEINRLKSSQGQLISMNSFLSTSTNKKKALEFATSRPPPNDQLTSILLEINLHLNDLTKPFADIKLLSAFPKEEEILFMFGCIFRLDQIHYDEQIQLWMCKLTLCSQDDPDIKDFISTLQEQLKGQNQTILIGNYFSQMLKFDDAQQHFEKILKNKIINDPIELAYCHHGLGKVNEKKGDNKSSIENLNKALNYLTENCLSNDHPLISQCYNDLGLIYLNENNSQIAFDFFDKALNTINNIPSITYFGLSQIHFKLKHYNIALQYLEKTLDNQSTTSSALIADTYIHMGKVYTAMNKKEKASEMFDKANQFQLKDLPPDHPDIGYTYSAQGLMHLEHGDEQKALEFIERAYQLQSQVLPNNHPDFGESYQNFANLYMKKGDLDQALIYYQKQLENQLKTLSSSHPSVIQTYSNIGNIYWKKRDYHQASTYFHQILDSELQTKKVGHPLLSSSYKNLGDLYFDKYLFYSDQKYLDQALPFYLKYLQNQLETKLYQDPQLIHIYQTIAQIYYKKHQLSESLLYYNRLLDCHLREMPFNQSIIDKISISIGNIYLKKHHFNKKLLYYHNIEMNQSENEYKNIDNIYFEKRHLDQSLNYFEKLLNQKIENDSKKDSSLMNIYYILGNICLEKQNFDQTLKYFLHILDNHSYKNQSKEFSLKYLYKSIANIYFEKHNYDQSLIYLYKLLDYQFQTKSIEHRSIIRTYTNIGNIYLKKNPFHHRSKKQINQDLQFEKYYLDQTLFFFQNLLNKNITHFSIDDIYTIITNIYLEKQDFNQALIFQKRFIDNQLEKNRFGNPEIAHSYFIIANIYDKLGDSDQALQNYRQSLSIYQGTDPQNGTAINKIQHKINHLLPPLI